MKILDISYHSLCHYCRQKIKAASYNAIVIAIIVFSSCASTQTNFETTGQKAPIALEIYIQHPLFTQIMNAASVEASKMIIDKNDALHSRDQNNATLLHHAVWNNRLQLAKYLIESGANVNAQRKDGFAPLHWAAYKGYRDIAVMLILAGAEFDLQAIDGSTPLHLASWKNNEELEKLLLISKANIDIIRNDKCSPQDLAAESSHDVYNLVRGLGPEKGILQYELATDPAPLIKRYGSSFTLSYIEQGAEFYDDKEPEKPPYATSALQIEGSFDYIDTPSITVAVTNTGKGNLYRVIADVRIDKFYTHVPVYFGLVKPGETIRRKIDVPGVSVFNIDSDLAVTVSFKEANGFIAPEQKGLVKINTVDKNWLFDHFLDIPVRDIFEIVEGNHVTPEDLENILVHYKDKVPVKNLIAMLYFELPLSTELRGMLITYRYQDLPWKKVLTIYKNDGVSKEVFEDYLALNRDTISTTEFVDISLETNISSDLINKFILFKKNLTTGNLLTLFKKRRITQQDISRYVLLNSSTFTIYDVRHLVDKNVIGRNEIDKLTRFRRVDFTIDDLYYFCEKEIISQDNIEFFLLQDEIDYKTSDIIALAEKNYISKHVVEGLYKSGMRVSADQMKRLIELEVFTKPEILYTYTINDGDSENSVGNRDGMIQAGEGIDFTYIIKNNSVFDIHDAEINVIPNNNEIFQYTDLKVYDLIKSNETIKLVSTFQVKPGFTDNTFSLLLELKNPFFGNLLKKTSIVQVGREVGNSILALNKDVVSTEDIIVYSGASTQSSELASLSEGALFGVVGELNDFYKVKVLGQYGWIHKEWTKDYSESDEGTFVVQELFEGLDSLVEDWDVRKNISWDEYDSLSETEKYFERSFLNAKPELVIISPHNNDEVYNKTDLEFIAIDRTFGIQSIDIKVNGTSLPGSTERGLRIIQKRNSKNDMVRKKYSLSLQKGINTVTVTAYNQKNVASESQTIRLLSLGVKNQPRFYVLSIGVSDYANASQNLTYADMDARKIAELFSTQDTAGLYESIHTELLVNSKATRENIKDKINFFLSDARKQDVVILFFAGHGTTDARGRYYFLGYDADIENPAANGIKESDFGDDLIASIQAQKVIVMLDSCHSGGVTAVAKRGVQDITQVVERLSEATGYIFMSAARKNEYAYESTEWQGGAFTLAVEEALKKGKADINNDSFIGINELNAYVYNRVIELTNSKQHPSISGLSIEDFSFYATQ